MKFLSENLALKIRFTLRFIRIVSILDTPPFGIP